MLKINENIINTKQLPSYVYQHLVFLSPTDIKSLVITYILIFLDLGSLPLLYPKVTIIYYFSIPLLVLAHFWAIRLLFKNPYSTQFESLLFMGVVGVIGSVCYFVLIQKTAFLNLGIKTPVYYILSSIIFLLVVTTLVYYQLYIYSDIDKKKKSKIKKNRSLSYGAVIAILPGFGVFFAHKVMKQSEFSMYIMMYFVYVIFVVIMAYFAARFLHQYAFMKANMRFVRYHKPEKKVIKQAEAKGKKFIIK